MPKFADIVEEVTSLNMEEMQEIRDIITKILAEKRREEFLKNKSQSEQLYNEGKLKFYDNSSDLLNALNEE
jgi:hypothetical protein